MSSVSVIIPTYNGGKHLLSAVNSVLEQTHTPLEILVVDDGSQEDIPQTLSSVSQKITYIRQNNAGPGAARNKGIELARGEFIALLDDDDLWHPMKIEHQLDCISNNPECALVYSIPLFIDETDTVIAYLPPLKCPSGYAYNELVKSNYVYTPSATLIKKTVFSSVGMFDESKECISCEDYDMWIRIAQKT